jgi:hypothetical protein
MAVAVRLFDLGFTILCFGFTVQEIVVSGMMCYTIALFSFSGLDFVLPFKECNVM